MIDFGIGRPTYLTIASFVLLCAGSARAGLSAAPPYAILSPDGTRVLVMMTNDPEDDYRAGPVLLPRGQVGIRQSFPTSGCYDTATLSPIWQVNWYAFQRDLRYSPDFSYIAWRNGFAFHRNPALWFYRDGKLIRQYNRNELLVAFRNWRFIYFTTDDYQFAWYDRDKFAIDGDELKLSTGTRRFYLYGQAFNLGWHEDYRFDIRTGEMTGRHIGGIGRAVMMLIVLPLTFPLVIVEACRRSIRWVRCRLRNTVGFPVLPKPSGR